MGPVISYNMIIKNLIFILLISLLLVSYNSNSSPKEEILYIKTEDITGSGPNQIEKETIGIINTDYFEVKLHAQTTGGFLAQKTIVEPKIHETFKYVFFTIVKEDGTKINFPTSTEFLNFMSARGYDMVSQLEDQYGNFYTFKRKK